MSAGVSNYATRAALDTLAGNLPDTTGKQQDGSGDPNANIANLLDVHSQAIAALEAYLGTGSSTTPPGGGKVPVSNASGTSDWADIPAGTPATAVIANTTYGRASAVGFGAKYAREDHDHGMPGVVKEAIFPFAAVTSPTTGTYRYRVKAPATLLSVRAELGTVASSGADAIFDVNVNGTSRISAGKPQITVGQSINTNAQTFTSTALSTNDLITVDIDQGSDGFQATVIVELIENSAVGGSATNQDFGWMPSDQGFLGWTGDPAYIAAGTALASGTVYVGAVAVRRSITVSTVWCNIPSTQGSGLTASQNFMGLYDSSGNRLAVTGDMTTDFGSTGTKSKALTVAQALGPGVYYVAVLSNGTTPPSLARFQGSSNVLANVANLTAATARWASNATAQTSLPASLTMASNVTSGTVDFWFAIS